MISICKGNAPAIRRPCEIADPVGMHLQGRDVLAVGCIPDADRLVSTGRGDACAIRAPGHCRDGEIGEQTVMAIVVQKLLPCDSIPDMYGFINACCTARRCNACPIGRPGQCENIGEQTGMSLVDDDSLPGGSVPHIDFCTISCRGNAQSFGRPCDVIDGRRPVHVFEQPGMASIRQQGLPCIGIPDSYPSITSGRGDAIATGFPGYCNHPAGMDVIRAKSCSYCLSGRGDYWIHLSRS